MKIMAQHTQTYETQWMKAVVRGKLIALSALVRKLERFYTSNLIAHLKALDQKKEIHSRGVEESTKPKACPWKKSTRLKTKQNKTKQNKTKTIQTN